MKKGEIIVFERGEYDSFDYFDPVIVLKSFSKKKISQKFAEEHKKIGDLPFQMTGIVALRMSSING